MVCPTTSALAFPEVAPRHDSTIARIGPTAKAGPSGADDWRRAQLHQHDQARRFTGPERPLGDVDGPSTNRKGRASLAPSNGENQPRSPRHPIAARQRGLRRPPISSRCHRKSTEKIRSQICRERAQTSPIQGIRRARNAQTTQSQRFRTPIILSDQGELMCRFPRRRVADTVEIEHQSSPARTPNASIHEAERSKSSEIRENDPMFRNRSERSHDS